MAQRYSVPGGKTTLSPSAPQQNDSIAPSAVGGDSSAASGLPKVVRKPPTKGSDGHHESEDTESLRSSARTETASEPAATIPNGAVADNGGSRAHPQEGVDSSMGRLRLDNEKTPAAPAHNGSASTVAAATAAPTQSAEGSAASGAAVDASPQPTTCGVGIRFSETSSGEFKITQLVPDSPAAACPALAVGDVIVKVDGVAVQGKSVQEVIGMIVGTQGSEVKITVLSQCGYPHVMTAPFQALPFDLKKDKKKKRAQASEAGFLGQFHDSNLYGGGTLPPGFEHLESLRSAKPYTNPSLSIRTVSLIRQLFPPGPDNAVPGTVTESSSPTAAAAAAVSRSASAAAAAGAAARGRGVHPAGRIVGI